MHKDTTGKKHKDAAIPLDRVEEIVHESVKRSQKTVAPVLSRFPTLMLLLVAFGFVALEYGFERIIESVPLFSEHGIVVFVLGLAILVVTGRLYAKLR